MKFSVSKKRAVISPFGGMWTIIETDEITLKKSRQTSNLFSVLANVTEKLIIL